MVEPRSGGRWLVSVSMLDAWSNDPIRPSAAERPRLRGRVFREWVPSCQPGDADTLSPAHVPAKDGHWIPHPMMASPCQE